MRRQARGPADDEDQLRGFGRIAEIVRARRDRAVDVDRQRLDDFGHRRLQRAHERDARPRFAVLFRNREQDRRPRILAVQAVAKARQAAPFGPRLERRRTRDIRRRTRLARRSRQRVRDHHHAGHAGAGVRIADRENAGGDGRFRRLTIAGRRHPRGRRARRTGAVIRDADQDRVDQPPLAFVWHVSAQQERDDVGVACRVPSTTRDRDRER